MFTSSMLQRLRARAERLAAPGYGHCKRCKRPWNVVSGHITFYEDQRGCFPLCEFCWLELGTPEARLPYYRKQLDSWKAGWLASQEPFPGYIQELEDRWPHIEEAVMQGG